MADSCFILLFGVNTFALRLPSAIMSSASVFLTYMIGSELYNRKVGFVAAFLQALNPLIMNLVHGYMFSDHINIALIFWVELSCYLLIKGLKSGKIRYYIWSGVAQGFGYLTKSYLCLVSFGIAVAALVLTRVGILKWNRSNISFRKVVIQAVFSILVAAPWVIFCLIKYTKEFIHENNMVLAHVSSQVENWDRPWDFHLFGYIPGHYPFLYLVIFASSLFLIISVVKRREISDCYLALWIFVVLIPLSISISKVPAGADIAIPAFLICFAAVFFKMYHSNNDALSISYFALVFSLFFLSQGPFHLLDGMREPVAKCISRVALIKEVTPTLHSSSWIIYRFLCSLIALAFFFAVYIFVRLFRNSLWRQKYIAIIKIATVVMLVVLVCFLTRDVIRITDKKPESLHVNHDGYYTGGFEDIGSYIKENMSENSVFLLETPTSEERLYLMFFADRTSYHLEIEGDDTGTLKNAPSVITVRENGGVPYLVSVKEYDYQLVYKSFVKPGYRIYSLE